MSLVAYASSSDDESGTGNEGETQSPINKRTESDGHISDEEDPVPTKNTKQMRKTLVLPVPKREDEFDDILPLFGKLPMPKSNLGNIIEMIEEDDEFLHKKAIPLETPVQKVTPMAKKRITIPSLKDFDDVKKRIPKNTDVSAKTSTFSSLISILPRPKSEQSFVKAKPANNLADSKKLTEKNGLVPDSVKNRRPAKNTENVENVIKKCPPKAKQKASVVEMSDSGGSDNEGADFFSLQNDDNLPEVSADEIAAMVSKKAAEMAKVSSTFASVSESNKSEEEAEELEDTSAVKSGQTQLNEEAIQALFGSQAKRRKMDEVQVIDISSDQVLPNKDEWLRTALASATTYQSTGVLTDEEPAAGTRRKHQITYLAHKAKANEAELQAMWSANRQNRRQTQSKYGF